MDLDPTLPERMNAIEIAAPGGPDVLRLAQPKVPEPGDGEVLIHVAAAGVNRPDVMQRMGDYPPPPGASDLPGLEVAGTVVALGRDVVRPDVGDMVCALVTGGGYAEYCVAAAPLCLTVPGGLSVTEAAALPETYYTVWTNVFQRGALKPRESLLVHGGSSGIGTTAIQLARAFGAKVFVTAGSDAKCAACLELGADAAINYREADFVERIKALTDDGGVNLILDMVGGDYLPRNLTCLAIEGRLVQIALQHGRAADIDLLPVMLKRLTVTGSTLRARSVAQKSEIAVELREKVWPLLANGTVKPLVYATFPLAEAPAAHRLMESSEHVGKIVLTVTPT